MQKPCQCGDTMTMKLRTVIYSGKVEIDNVPIFSCDSCSKSEVIPEVKSDLTGLISQLGSEPNKQTFLFNECNEWADLLVEAKVTKQLPSDATMQELMKGRINALLDMYLLAQSLDDKEWLEDVKKRLEQLSRRPLHT
ncbi:hypothetical protein M6D81_09690 [Paenibacillus sp. J5C_2022]|uniref:hypothetical protein n=1 Tax=Paenibacillus sp. J5C2022 TaxID=2977129 RepID=UPI0021CDF5FD|nr:hypothetical protein [Paenibacillus sp. J5C2022]MCU6708992.1 hypothetical protein [Paenibacillus sp. J5C2022]